MKKFNKEELERQWYNTRYQLREAGLWPKDTHGWFCVFMFVVAVCFFGYMYTHPK